MKFYILCDIEGVASFDLLGRGTFRQRLLCAYGTGNGVGGCRCGPWPFSPAEPTRSS